jgi:hypothetical protein
MRIERGQHSVDRAFDQLIVLDLIGVIVAHQLEHVAEQVELLVGLGCVRRGGRCRGGGANILVQPQHNERCGRSRDQPRSLHSHTL